MSSSASVPAHTMEMWPDAEVNLSVSELKIRRLLVVAAERGFAHSTAALNGDTPAEERDSIVLRHALYTIAKDLFKHINPEYHEH